MNMIRYNLTNFKACRILQLSQNHYIRKLGYFLKKLNKCHLFAKDLYTRLYHLYMFEPFSLLVY